MKIAILLILIVSAHAESSPPANDTNSLEWASYKEQFEKNYSQEEDAMRFKLFLAVKEQIKRHNEDGQSSYQLGLNKMSDWSEAEFTQLLGPHDDAVAQENHLEVANGPFLQAILNDQAPVPKELDWREKPWRVSPVKDQGRCKSGWAFSAVGCLEGQLVTRNISNKMIELSEQSLVDCDQSSKGCSGGSVDSAFTYVAKNKGIPKSSSYKYKGIKNKCRTKAGKVTMRVKGFFTLPRGKEDILKKVVARYGPVSTSIKIGGLDLNLYKSGVFKAKKCGQFEHAVLIVGYGTCKKWGDYWIVKNSWGKCWGEVGYFRLARGQGMCGIGEHSFIAKF